MNFFVNGRAWTKHESSFGSFPSGKVNSRSSSTVYPKRSQGQKLLSRTIALFDMTEGGTFCFISSEGTNTVFAPFEPIIKKYPTCHVMSNDAFATFVKESGEMFRRFNSLQPGTSTL